MKISTKAPWRTTKWFLIALVACLPALVHAQWSQISVPTTRDLNDAEFLNPDLGWIVGDWGTLLKTTDGGLSWVSQFSDTTSNFVSVAFLDSNTGFVAKEYSGLLVTFDGGATWTNDTLIKATGCFGIKVRTDAQRVFYTALGCFGGTSISSYDFISGDTSDRFEYYTPLSANFSYPVFRDLGFPGAVGVVALGDENIRAHSGDHGETYTLTAPNDTLMDWRAIDFDANGIGHAVTTDEFQPLYKSQDGGTTWVVDSTWVSTFFYPVPSDVEYPSPNHGVVTAKIGWATTGLIIETGLPGNPFQYFGADNVLNAVSMVDDSVGYAVGDSGMVMKRLAGPLAVQKQVAGVEFQVFPNPSQGQFQVLWNGSGTAKVELLDLTGRVVLAREMAPGIDAFKVEGLAKGVYALRLSTDAGMESKRLVLQ